MHHPQIVSVRERKNQVAKWLQEPGNVLVNPEEELGDANLSRSRWYPETQTAAATAQNYSNWLQTRDLLADLNELMTNQQLGYSDETGQRLDTWLLKLADQDVRRPVMEAKYRNTSLNVFSLGELHKFFPIVGLQHITRSPVASILKHGLLTNLELYKRPEVGYRGFDVSHQAQAAPTGRISFPGVFFTAVLEKDLGTLLPDWDYSKVALIIVDPYVLNRYDFHVNAKDNFGRLTQDSYSRPTLPYLLDRLNFLKIGEIVFHNGIEPEFIREIRVENPDEVKAQLEAQGLGRFAHLIRDHYYFDEKPYYETDQKILQTVYRPLLAEPRAARFCVEELPDGSLATEWKVAFDCGITTKDVEERICPRETTLRSPAKCSDAVYDEIHKRSRDQYKKWPTQYYPPFGMGSFLPEDLAFLEQHHLLERE